MSWKHIFSFITYICLTLLHYLFFLKDDRFDNQPAHGLLPRLLVTPFEQLLLMCTKGLSDANRDIMVGLLADAYCERVEHYISQVR